MECCVNALVTSFKETILAECPGMIKRNETESEYKGSAWHQEAQLMEAPGQTSQRSPSLMMRAHLPLLTSHML